MGVPLLPYELDAAELVVEMAWGADAFGADPTPAPEWTDVTHYVRQSEPVSITRGRSDEADTTQPAKCTIRFDNTDGAFSLAGDSPNWPNVRRGVPVRVRVPNVVDGLYLHGRDAPNSFALGAGLDTADPWTPTAPDIDVRIDLEPDTWRPTAFQAVAAQWVPGSGDNAFVLRLLPGGEPELGWSSDGSDETKRAAPSIPEGSGRVALRVTLDVDDGAGNHVLTWYTADTIAGPWTVYHTDTIAGTTAVHDSSHFVAVGALSNGDLEFANEIPYRGMVYDVEIRDGIDGPAAVDAGFSDADPWPGAYIGPDGNQWAVYDGGEIVGGVLFIGYAVGFPPSWSLSGADAVVTMTAAGSLRRLEGRSKPLASTMTHALPSEQNLVAYWPMEEGERAGSFASGLANSTATLNPRGDVTFGDFEGIPGSAPIPTIEAGSIDGNVPQYELVNNATYAMFLLSIPEAGMHDSEDSLICRIRTTSTGIYARWDIHATPAGDIRTRVYNSSGDEDTGMTWHSEGWGLNGFTGMMMVQLRQNVMAVELEIAIRAVGADQGQVAAVDYGNSSARPIQAIQLGDRRHSGGAAFGQLTVWAGTGGGTFWETTGDLMNAYAGETATDRLSRLAVENDVYLKVIGASDVPMGPQPIDTFMSAMRECERADQGVLLDAVGPGLYYLARTMRESVAATVTLDAAAGDVAPEFEPVHDDQNIVNRFTAQQVDGTSVTVEQVDGPVGTRAVDVYDEERDLNVNAAGPLRDYAAWRVHLGTNDGYRYPSAGSNLRASPHLAAPWLRALPSSRVDIVNARGAFPTIPDGDLHLLVEGTETNISPYQWTVTAQCSSYDPWRVGIAADVNGNRAGEYATPADTVESHVFAPAAQGATAVDVATVAGPYWGGSDAPYDLNAAGHVVTVTGVSEGVYADTFARTVSPGWGAADTGQGYTYFAPGGEGDFSVSSGDGLVSLTTADASVLARVASTTGAYVDHSATLVVPSQANDSAGIWHGLATAYVDDDNYAFAILRYVPADGVILQLSTFVGGFGGTHGTRTVATSYAAGAECRLRVRKAGASILARAWWPSSEDEPLSWHVGATVPELAGAGEFGTYAAALSGGTYTLPVEVTYRDVAMHNPQRLAVDPTPAALPAGGPVEVHNPPIAGL